MGAEQIYAGILSAPSQSEGKLIKHVSYTNSIYTSQEENQLIKFVNFIVIAPRLERTKKKWLSSQSVIYRKANRYN